MTGINDSSYLNYLFLRIRTNTPRVFGIFTVKMKLPRRNKRRLELTFYGLTIASRYG